MMDFIELMKEVWMTAEKRKQEEENWERRREVQQWEQNTSRPAGGADGDMEIPVLRPENSAGGRRGLNRSNVSNRAIGQAIEGFGNLSTMDRERMDSMGAGNIATPPGYSQHANFPLASQSSETIPKQPVSDDTCRSQGAGGLISSCDKKIPSRTNSREDESGDSGEAMTSQEKTELLSAIQILKDEQQLLRTKMEEHDKHLTSILAKQPSMRQRLSVKVSEMMMAKAPPTDTPATNNNRFNKRIKDEDTIYAQIEQLYANLCRIHFPAQQKVAQYMALSESQHYASPRVEDSCHYVSLGSIESETLKKENKELKEKIKMLEKSIEEMKAKSNANDLNRIEPLKYTCAASESSLHSFASDTTDNNWSPYSYHDIVKRDVQHVSSTFEWTIQNYFEKLELEKWGKCASLLSEPFFTEQFGYRARLEVYLNGNGTGYGRCLSVFMSIIKSDYDNHLKWPASFLITFILMNQDEANMESLMHEANFTFDRPSSDPHGENNTWGLIEFVPHSVINKRQYIKNDTIKLKIRTVKC